MVKADAYNHGLKEVVGATEGIVTRFGVATCDEGERVRSMTEVPVTVFSYTAEDVERVLRYRLTPLVRDSITLNSVLGAGISEVDIKADTGMRRFGFDTEIELKNAICALRRDGIEVRAIHTHFYSDGSAERQYAKFLAMTDDIGGNPKKIYSASTGIAKGMYGDGVRAGLIAYKGAMCVRSRILQINRVRKGETVGYDGRYIAAEDVTVGVIGGGYYDGIMRAYSGAGVIVNGARTRIIANVCMDVAFVDLNGIVAKVGDEVTLISPNTIGSYMRCAKTNEYEILTSVKGRTKRRYIVNG